jgi:hypothetical protein
MVHFFLKNEENEKNHVPPQTHEKQQQQHPTINIICRSKKMKNTPKIGSIGTIRRNGLIQKKAFILNLSI